MRSPVRRDTYPINQHMNTHLTPEDDLSALDAEAYRVAYLIAGYLQHTLTPAEHEELDRWVEASDRNMQLFEELTEEDKIPQTLHWARTLGKGSQPAISALRKRPKRMGHRYWPLAAAACLLLVAGGLWWHLRMSAEKAASPSPVSIVKSSSSSHRAVLALESGATVALSATDTSITLPGGSLLHAGPQGLCYPTGKGTASLSSTHALRTPRGATYTVLLPDSTRVWLNAASTLRYPSQFTEGTREVTLSGEAYFEVRRDLKQPFIVRTAGQVLQVLGTTFNVEAYTPQATTTLVEGRVKISGSGGSTELEAGEQLAADSTGHFQKTAHADVAAALGWQSDQFVFRDASLTTILAQFARWYDIEVAIRDPVPDQFTATIPRSLPLERALAVLELTGKVRFHRDGKALWAIPARESPK